MKLLTLHWSMKKKFDTITTEINKIINEKFEKLEAEISLSQNVNNKLKEQLIMVEKQCWKNEQYSRRECVEVCGLPENISEKDVVDLCNELDVNINDLEACHPIKSKGMKRIILKFGKRKHCKQVLVNRSKLKGMDLTAYGVEEGKSVYINESLCGYYKGLWSKCKKLRDKHNFFSFWTWLGINIQKREGIMKFYTIMILW